MGDSFPNSVALVAPSSSFPVETVAIFLVFDDPKISSRSHGEIEIPRLPLSTAMANVSELRRFHFTSSILPSAFRLILDFLCMPVRPMLRFRKRKEPPRLDLRMNIPSAGEFITFIYVRVSNSYPSTTLDRQTVLLRSEATRLLPFFRIRSSR